MSEKTRTYVKAVVIVAALGFVWWYLRTPKTVQQQAQMSPWDAPFYQVNPGINDGLTYQTSQPPVFNASNTLNYYDGQIQGLSNQYIPMFGLVGMTAVSA